MEINYQYYTDTYGGSEITSDKWLYFSNKAKAKINYLTFNKASQEFNQFTNEISNAICAIAELIQSYELKLKATQESDLATLKRGIKSETVKSHSKTYEVSRADIESNLSNASNQQIAKVVREYLLPTGLLYRGL